MTMLDDGPEEQVVTAYPPAPNTVCTHQKCKPPVAAVVMLKAPGRIAMWACEEHRAAVEQDMRQIMPTLMKGPRGLEDYAPFATGATRTFATGATRDADVDKYDYEGFLSPTVLERFAEYMHANRVQSNGDVRDSDNWQKGIPRDQYMKSMFRHFMDVWGQHRASAANDTLVGEDALCALLFNVMGYLHETLQWEAE